MFEIGVDVIASPKDSPNKDLDGTIIDIVSDEEYIIRDINGDIWQCSVNDMELA